MKTLQLFLALAFAACLTSCETTGDPAAGGFFGWSEEKSNQRIYAKENELYGIQSDTARQRSRAQYYESQY